MYNPSEKEEEYFLRQEMERLKALREEHARRMAEEERRRLKETHYLHCAKCGQHMETTTVAGVEIEVCPDCGGVFLDAGELEKLTEAQREGAFAKALGAVRRIWDEVTR